MLFLIVFHVNKEILKYANNVKQVTNGEVNNLEDALKSRKFCVIQHVKLVLVVELINVLLVIKKQGFSQFLIANARIQII